MTSYADFEYAKKAIELGVSAYLMKPVDQEELRANIEKVISEIEKDNQLRQFTEKMKTADDIDTLFIKSDKENDYVQQVLTATIRIHRRLIL